jgi:exosome complex component RRP4
LHLASINLPGGILRRRTTEDELKMRTFFAEGDLLVAEVQQLFSDGAASLHTRSLKYGKLRNGVFLSIPPMLVVRSKSHMYSLGQGVHCILGVNGFVWVSKEIKTANTVTGSITRIEEEASEAIYSNVNEDIDTVTRRQISRACNCIMALANVMVPISEDAIRRAIEASNAFSNLSDLLLPGNIIICSRLTAIRCTRTTSSRRVIPGIDLGCNSKHVQKYFI